jgi:hypothetical protein
MAATTGGVHHLPAVRGARETITFQVKLEISKIFLKNFQKESVARFWLFYHKRRVNSGVLQPPTSEEQKDWMQMDKKFSLYDFTKFVQQVSVS